MALRAVLLDVDDTLVDTRGAFRARHHVRGRDVAAAPGRRQPRGRRPALGARPRRPLPRVHAGRGRLRDAAPAAGGGSARGLRWAGAGRRGARGAGTPATRTPSGARGGPVRTRRRSSPPSGRPGLPMAAVTNMLTSYQVAKLEAVGLAGFLCGGDRPRRGRRRQAGPAAVPARLPPARRRAGGGRVHRRRARRRRPGRPGRRACSGVWLDRHGTGLEPGDVPVVRTLAEAARPAGVSCRPRHLIWVRPSRHRYSSAAGRARLSTGACTPMGYGVIGSTTDSGSVSLGSSPGTPARLLRACTLGSPGPHGPVV